MRALPREVTGSDADSDARIEIENTTAETRPGRGSAGGGAPERDRSARDDATRAGRRAHRKDVAVAGQPVEGVAERGQAPDAARADRAQDARRARAEIDFGEGVV